MAYQLDLDGTNFDTNNDNRLVISTWRFTDTFDVQVDWLMTGLSGNFAPRHHPRLLFQAYDGRGSNYGYVFASKYLHQNIYLPNSYRMYRSPGVTMAVINTNAESGSWRIVRSEMSPSYTTEILYKDDSTGGGWVSGGVHSINWHAYIVLQSQFIRTFDSDPLPTPYIGRFDNFKVNSHNGIIFPEYTIDYTVGYVPQDPDSRFTINAHRIDFANLEQGDNVWVTKDYGTDRFLKNMIWEWDAEVTYFEPRNGNDVAQVIMFGASNWTHGTFPHWDANNDGLMVDVYNDSDYNGVTIRLREFSNDSADYYYDGFAWTGGEGGTTYMPHLWFRLVRAATEVNLYIYTDENRTNLLDTLSITSSSDSSRRYITAVAGRANTGSTKKCTGYVANLYNRAS
jgi:hypothetical protein